MKTRRHLVGIVLSFVLVSVLGFSLAHPHVANPAHQGAGQPIANSQNHGPYEDGVTCGGDPAVYGLESAHHGPDSGTPGKSDGCYQIDGTAPALDDQNPAID